MRLRIKACAAIIALLALFCFICPAAANRLTDYGATGAIKTGKGGPQPITICGKQYMAFLSECNIGICTKAGKQITSERIGEKQSRILSSCSADLDGDGSDEILLIAAKPGEKYGDGLIIYSFQAEHTKSGTEADFTLKPTYSVSLEDLNPWKIQAADIDGDKEPEISIGVYKTAQFHPVMAKRPFIYSWKGNAIAPKWLGSRLSKPFEDYLFSDVDGDGRDELISVEILSDGRKVINLYAWKGFGFESLGESQGFQDIAHLTKSIPDSGRGWKISASVRENSAWSQAVVSFKEGRPTLLSINNREGG